jgi:glycosyltransferase involved in cell wall biosynthesis
MKISVVIITKNEETNIAHCIQSAMQVSEDIIVVDSGSSDNTVQVASQWGARIVRVAWSSFGNSRNEGADLALNDWILALDADERISNQLANSINKLNPVTSSTIFGFKRQSFLADKKIRFGDWGRDKVFRIYSRSMTSWNLFPVHESLLINRLKRRMIKGNLEHFVSKGIDRDREKLIRYAKLCARKYCLLGKRARLINIIASPAFSFVNGYFFRLGFLDGKEGFEIAKSMAYYTWLKYYYLQQLSSKPGFFLKEIM